MSTNSNKVQIKDFQSFFNEEILDYETKRLTAPGENYGSLMLAVTVTFKNNDKKMEVVAKMVPDNEIVQKLFKSPITFKKELGFYQIVIPTLQAFQLEQDARNVMDFFPEFYGGRMGLGANLDEFDNDALILQENLKFSGYTTADRTIGFDLATTKILLRDLAELHGVALALKLKKPEVFKSKVLPHIQPANCFSGFTKERKAFVYTDIESIIKKNPKCAEFVPRYRAAVEFADDCDFDKVPPKEPFATLIHCDFWVNNTMVKFDANGGRPIHNKMVDFQMTEYQSPAKDLTFFLFTSVQSDVIVTHYDALVKEYHDHLIATLKEMKIEDVSMFNWIAFQEEITRVVKERTVVQITTMLQPIFETSNVKDVEELTIEYFSEEFKTTRRHDEKLWMIIEQFALRNWI